MGKSIIFEKKTIPYAVAVVQWFLYQDLWLYKALRWMGAFGGWSLKRELGYGNLRLAQGITYYTCSFWKPKRSVIYIYIYIQLAFCLGLICTCSRSPWRGNYVRSSNVGRRYSTSPWSRLPSLSKAKRLCRGLRKIMKQQCHLRRNSTLELWGYPETGCSIYIGL